MITIARIGGQAVLRITELYGLSTDVSNLPTEDISNGSSFYAMDTKKAYLFDEENKVWIQQ